MSCTTQEKSCVTSRHNLNVTTGWFLAVHRLLQSVKTVPFACFQILTVLLGYDERQCNFRSRRFDTTQVSFSDIEKSKKRKDIKLNILAFRGCDSVLLR